RTVRRLSKTLRTTSPKHCNGTFGAVSSNLESPCHPSNTDEFAHNPPPQGRVCSFFGQSDCSSSSHQCTEEMADTRLILLTSCSRASSWCPPAEISAHTATDSRSAIGRLLSTECTVNSVSDRAWSSMARTWVLWDSLHTTRIR